MKRAVSTVLGIVLCAAAGAVPAGAQEVQTAPVTLVGEEQTAAVTLESVISLIQENTLVPETHVETLTLLVSTAVELGLITPEQALDLLETVGWADLTAEDKIGLAVRALELALAAITAEGAAYDEVLAALQEVVEIEELGPLASGERDLMALLGVIKALRESGEELSAVLLQRIAEALDSDVPAGQVVRLVRSLTRQGANEEEILAALEELIEEGHGQGHGSNGKGEHPGKGKGGKGKGADKGEDDDGKNGSDKPGHGKGKGSGKGKGPGKGKGG